MNFASSLLSPSPPQAAASATVAGTTTASTASTSFVGLFVRATARAAATSTILANVAVVVFVAIMASSSSLVFFFGKMVTPFSSLSATASSSSLPSFPRIFASAFVVSSSTQQKRRRSLPSSIPSSSSSLSILQLSSPHHDCQRQTLPSVGLHTKIARPWRKQRGRHLHYYYVTSTRTRSNGPFHTYYHHLRRHRMSTMCQSLQESDDSDDGGGGDDDDDIDGDDDDLYNNDGNIETARKNNNNEYKDMTLLERLDMIYNEIKLLNDGQDLNVNSPKQVSTAIFGSPRTATRTVLEEIASSSSSSSSSNNAVPYEKQRLARLVLDYKALLKECFTTGSSPPAAPTTETTGDLRTRSTTSSYGDNETNPSTPTNIQSISEQNIGPKQTSKRRLRPRHKTQSDQQLSHEQVVESLFNTPESKIDEYWKGPLLQLSRPTARELLIQLDPRQCPMGFDPDATPKNRLTNQKSSQQSNNAAAKSTSTMGRKGTFLSFCRLQKELYPQCVILVRCGDFYETYGIDAILLVEHVGLNSMAGKVKAGCPWRNIQATVDGLTQQGFSVAVYEEVSQVDTNAGNVKSSNKLKTRVLTQIVTPASPTYLFDNWLLAGGGSVVGGDVTGPGNNGGGFDHISLHGLPPSRPCVGVVRTSAGYNMIEVSLEERSIQFSERLTQEAVACRLAAYPPADPLIYVPSTSEYEKARGTTKGSVIPSFLPQTRTSRTTNDIVESSLGGYRLRVKLLSPQLIPGSRPGSSEVDGQIQAVVDALVRLNERRPDDDEEEDNNKLSSTKHFRRSRKRTAADDFTVTMTTASTNALYLETAKQIGLLPDAVGIPSLIHHVLDEAAPIATRRFLQRYLLIPPPPVIAQSMSEVVGVLIDPNNVASLPPLTVPNLGKVLSLIRAGQAGANVYGELLQSLATTLYVLEENRNDLEAVEGDSTKNLPVDALLRITQHESGLVADIDSMMYRCQSAIDIIESVLSSSYHVAESGANDGIYDEEDFVTSDDFVPMAFFERNEASWRGRVQPSVASTAYGSVQDAASRLCTAVREDFINDRDSNKSLIVQDIFNNLLALRQKPESGKEESKYFHPRDRNGKVLKNRWTTEAVQDALSDYVKACENATEGVSSILSTLAQTLQDEGHIPALIQSGHFNLILSTAFHHAAKAIKSRWELAPTIEYGDESDGDEHAVAHFVDVFPYWMPKSQAVSNTFDLKGMVLLTAPNMSGKSTLMRSTAAAALLNVCGLCAPVSSMSRIPRFDTLFVRGASADVPAEDKSAFGAEMEDVAALFRCCGPRSLVFVDELGRGTSPSDGTRLAGAVLEAMADRGMAGIFATHLHDVIDLPLRRKDRIETKRMAFLQDDDASNNYNWTYKVEEGICTDSLALVTAQRFGLPAEIIQRAEELESFLPDRILSNDDLNEDMTNEIVRENHDDHLSFDPSSVARGGVSTRDQARHFDQAIALATELTGRSPISIPPRWSPPASVANKSCLYILQLAEDPPRFYVGETDSLSQRLQQHRKKGGKKWSQCRAMALPVDNKSQARAYESSLIQAMAQSGFSMESLADGRSIRQYSDE